MAKYGDIDGQGFITPLPADFAISGQTQGDVLFFNGTNWVRLPSVAAGSAIISQGVGALTSKLFGNNVSSTPFGGVTV